MSFNQNTDQDGAPATYFILGVAVLLLTSYLAWHIYERSTRVFLKMELASGLCWIIVECLLLLALLRSRELGKVFCAVATAAGIGYLAIIVLWPLVQDAIYVSLRPFPLTVLLYSISEIAKIPKTTHPNLPIPQSTNVALFLMLAWMLLMRVFIYPYFLRGKSVAAVWAAMLTANAGALIVCTPLSFVIQSHFYR
jgi:hypothetical protein